MPSSARPAVEVHCSRGDDPGWASRTAVVEGARLAGRPVGQVALTHACPGCGSDAHGRPVLAAEHRVLPVQVSLSRAGGLSMVALAVAVRVGIDVEEVAGTGFEGFDDVCLHPAERASTPVQRAVMWTRKESLLKARGTGLRVDPRRVLLSAPDQPPRVLECPELGVPVDQVWMADLDAGEGWAASLTVLGAQRGARVAAHGLGVDHIE